MKKRHKFDLTGVPLESARKCFQSTSFANCNYLREHTAEVVWGMYKDVPVVRSVESKHWQLWFIASSAYATANACSGVFVIDADLDHYKHLRKRAKPKHEVYLEPWLLTLKRFREICTAKQVSLGLGEICVSWQAINRHNEIVCISEDAKGTPIKRAVKKVHRRLIKNALFSGHRIVPEANFIRYKKLYQQWQDHLKQKEEARLQDIHDQIHVCKQNIKGFKYGISVRRKKLKKVWQGAVDEDGTPIMPAEGSKGDRLYSKRCAPRIRKIINFKHDIAYQRAMILRLRDFPAGNNGGFIMAYIQSEMPPSKNFLDDLEGWNILNITNKGVDEYTTWCIFMKDHGSTHGALIDFAHKHDDFGVQRVVPASRPEKYIVEEIMKGRYGYGKRKSKK